MKNSGVPYQSNEYMQRARQRQHQALKSEAAPDDSKSAGGPSNTISLAQYFQQKDFASKRLRPDTQDNINRHFMNKSRYDEGGKPQTSSQGQHTRTTYYQATRTEGTSPAS